MFKIAKITLELNFGAFLSVMHHFYSPKKTLITHVPVLLDNRPPVPLSGGCKQFGAGFCGKIPKIPAKKIVK